jgi:GNAT superfamily N-acetyltransferase
MRGTSGTMLIRKAAPTDAPLLAEAFLSMMDEAGLGRQGAPDAVTRLAAAIEAGIAAGTQAWFVCDEGGTIVATGGAMFQASPFEDALFGKRAIIAGVYTRPEYRHRGMARQVVSAAVDWCRESDVAIVRLQTTEAARGLYESLGFKAGDLMALRLR